MANTVTLYIRESGTRRYIPATATHYPLGTVFCLRYKQAGKRVWETLPGVKTYGEGMAAALHKQIGMLTTPAPAPEPTAQPKPVAKVVANGATPMDQAIDKYLENAATKSGRTAAGYTYTMGEWYKSCRKATVQEVETQDLVDFVAYLRAKGNGDRTIHNKISEVTSFLRANKVRDVTLRVKFTEKIVRSYRPDELETLFKWCTPDEKLLYWFFLSTGVREQEAMYAEWCAVDFVDNIFYVRETARFKPKDREEREIAIDPTLATALKNKMLHSTGELMFPSPDGSPNSHMLRQLQAIAKRAALPGDFGLHKFRKTFATQLHRDGIDARSIQKMLGHSDLSTTLQYLEGESARSPKVRAAVGRTFGVFA